MFQDADKTALAFILNPPAAASGTVASPSISCSSSSSSSPTMSPSRKSHNEEDATMETASEGTASDDDDNKHALFHIQGRSLLSHGTIMETRVNQLLSHGNHHGKMRVRKSSICAQVDCPRAAVSRGRCVRHGVAAPGGFCWAHGGGNRCKMEGCNRRSYQKHDYYCKQHTTPM
ncbi:hypothetical protein FI667_g8049, partial [Globisporangium splendens]